MRMLTTTVGCFVVALLPMGSAADEDTVLAVQEGWPVPVVGTAVAYRTSIDFEADVKVEDREPQQVRLQREHSVQVRPASEGGGVEAVVTQGRRWGTMQMKLLDKTVCCPLPMVVTRRSNAVAGHAEAAGTRVSVRLTRDGRFEVEEKDKKQWAVSAFACGHLFPAPPPDTPRVGLEWEAGAIPPVGAEEKLDPIPSSFTVRALDAESVTVEIAWPDIAMPDGSAFTKLRQTLRISRRDGLPLDGSFEGAVRTRLPDIPVPVLTVVKGSMARRPWVDAPDSPTRAEQLLLDLAADDPEVRRAAAAALGKLWPDGAQAVPSLLVLRDDEEASVREAATASLVELSDRGLPEIVAFLGDAEDPDFQMYDQAVTAIRDLGAKVTPANAADFMDRSPRAGSVAMALWVASAPYAPRGPDGFFHASVVVLAPLSRRIVADGLALSDPRAVSLGAACTALAACAALPASSARTTPAEVLHLLDHPETSVVASAYWILDRLGASTDEVFAALRSKAKSPDPIHQRSAPAALARLGAPSAQSDLAFDDLTSESSHTRWEAALEIAYWKEGAAAAVPSLIEALGTIDWSRKPGSDVRGLMTVRALGQIGPAAAGAAPALEDALAAAQRAQSEMAITFRGEVATALCRIAGPRDAWVELVLAGAMACMRSERHCYRWDIRPLLETLDRCLDGLGAAARVRTARALDDLLATAKVGWRLAVLRSLGHLGPAAQQSIPQIVEHLETAERIYREAAGDGRDVTALARAVAELGRGVHRNIEIRAVATEALGRMGSAAEEAVPVLEELAAEGDPPMRIRVARALRRIRSSPSK